MGEGTAQPCEWNTASCTSAPSPLPLQLVNTYLGILDQITILSPEVYYSSLYINLSTGQREEVGARSSLPLLCGLCEGC